MMNLLSSMPPINILDLIVFLHRLSSSTNWTWRGKVTVTRNRTTITAPGSSSSSAATDPITSAPKTVRPSSPACSYWPWRLPWFMPSTAPAWYANPTKKNRIQLSIEYQCENVVSTFNHWFKVCCPILVALSSEVGRTSEKTRDRLLGRNLNLRFGWFQAPAMEQMNQQSPTDGSDDYRRPGYPSGRGFFQQPSAPPPPGFRSDFTDQVRTTTLLV